ncbi:uncharacterized protein [Miscanthus floridulus]|uniref:uncharacterized protein n=1 Tax=Miscanthus floridulus TaxID=154761 RepID=UPI003458103A
MSVNPILESPCAWQHTEEPVAAFGRLGGSERLSMMMNESAAAPSAMAESEAENLAVPKERMRGDDIVIVEEEDTTREFRRLETSLTGVMKQIKEITRIAEQRRQLIKRMEPLAEENEKLKEAMNLSERNIQRAQHERDLVESNARDLEYQKGVLAEKLAVVSEHVQSQSEQLVVVFGQLKTASEQLELKIEQLKSVSEQKAEQDVELGQLRQAIEQIRQEKAKEIERPDKLAEELKGEFLLVEITVEVASLYDRTL